jgi:hypothetical protein
MPRLTPSPVGSKPRPTGGLACPGPASRSVEASFVDARVGANPTRTEPSGRNGHESHSVRQPTRDPGIIRQFPNKLLR